ncbi:MAG: cell wall-binding repeat-containing protein, partial [Terriglobia bacterium]
MAGPGPKVSFAAVDKKDKERSTQVKRMVTANSKQRPQRVSKSFVAALILTVVISLIVVDEPGRAAAWHPAPPIDVVFPVEGGAANTCTFGAPRSGGRTHKGSDIFASKGAPLVAAVSGFIHQTMFGEHGNAGYRLWIIGIDGNSYFYAHLNNDSPGTDDGLGGAEAAYGPGIEAGAWVDAGDIVGYAGDSGNAEGAPPHVHFEVHPDAAGAVAPHRILKKAEDPGALEPQLEKTNFSAKLPQLVSDGEPPYFDTMIRVRRVYGATSEGTAAAVSKFGWSDARVAVLAREDMFPDALASVPLAYMFGDDPNVDTPVPLLLTESKKLSGESLSELKRLGVKIVLVVGGPGAIEDGVLKTLKANGMVPDRIWQSNLYGTAADVARRMRINAQNWGTIAPPTTAVVATGENFPDALAVSSAAAANNMPILLVEPTALPAETVSALKDLKIRKI